MTQFKNILNKMEMIANFSGRASELIGGTLFEIEHSSGSTGDREAFYFLNRVAEDRDTFAQVFYQTVRKNV